MRPPLDNGSEEITGDKTWATGGHRRRENIEYMHGKYFPPIFFLLILFYVTVTKQVNCFSLSIL